MSDNWMHFFPADPRQPKLNWIHLQEQLAATGFIIETSGDDIRTEILINLRRLILGARALPEPTGEFPRSLGDLARQLIEAGSPLELFPLDYESLSISQFVAGLIDRGLLPVGFDYVSARHYGPGPLYDEMCDVPHSRYGWNHTEIHFQDSGEEITVQVCQMDEPPGIPGTDRVLEEWVEFLEVWLDDPSLKWTDPDTGTAYNFLELEWNYLGAGKSFVSVKGPGYLNGPRVAAYLGEITGQPFRYSTMHI